MVSAGIASANVAICPARRRRRNGDGRASALRMFSRRGAVCPAADRPNDPLRVTIVAQHLADLPERGPDRCHRDETPAPDRRDHLVAADDPVAVPDQTAQEREQLRRDRDHLPRRPRLDLRQARTCRGPRSCERVSTAQQRLTIPAVDAQATSASAAVQSCDTVRRPDAGPAILQAGTTAVHIASG